MYDHKIHYCFTLSEEQMKYLRSKKYKIDRMECFMSLVKLAERETKLIQISKTQQIEILPGQVMVDNTQLAKLWDKDRKTVPKLIETMEALGISSSQKVGDNRIHTLHAFSGWYVDGMFVKNPFATRRNADGTAIVTAEVPPAKVITIEVPDDRNKDAEDSDSDSDNSQGGNAGVIPSADSRVPYPSPQSNDSGNVGKYGTDSKPSDVLQNIISSLSDGTLSSHPDTDGNLNEGKRNDEPSARQRVHSPLPQPNGTQFNSNGGYNQNTNS